ncbi:MAG: isoamylase early set domain-containing protein [Gemmatimonadales bacterium]|nr:isoamylase early set domain-containing protein [Gemmatimonadales bacterium]
MKKSPSQTGRLNAEPVLEQVVAALNASSSVRPGLFERTLRRRARRFKARVLGTAALAFTAYFVIDRVASSGAQRVTFSVDAPASAEVALVGDFTEWRFDAVRLKRGENGHWEATVPLLPGRYRFGYLIDGRVWQTDARAATMSDGFGHLTSVVTIAN